MATKSKKKAAPKKATAKKAKSKARKSPSRPKGPAVTVPNHPFGPATTVRFLPLHKITVERDLNREPMAKPDKTAKVKADGTLEVRGLQKGMWCAAGQVGDTWRYFQFSVK